MASRWLEKATELRPTDLVVEPGVGSQSKWVQKADTLDKPQSGVSGDFTKMTWKEALTEAILSLPGSGAELVKNLVTPIIHPIETVKSIGSLAAGTAEKLIPGEQKHEESFNKFVDFLDERYGNVENFKQTVSKDPVGVVSDIASLFMPAGAALKGVGAISTVSKLGTAGKVLSKVGAAIEPVGLAGRAVTVPLKLLIPEGLPSKLYQSAAKFSTTLTKDQRAKLTDTALENAILPNIKGLDKSRSMINEYASQVTQMIDDVQGSGSRIPMNKLFDDFGKLYADASLSVEPGKARIILDSARKQIMDEAAKMNRPNLTPREAQKLKVSIHGKLESLYSKMTQHPVKVDAQMAIASGARRALEELIPEIKEVNAKEGALLDLNKAILRSSARISNRDILGIGIPIKGSVGGIMAGTEGAIGAIALGLLDTPSIKARLAILAHRMKTRGIVINETPAAIRLGFTQAGRQELGEQEE